MKNQTFARHWIRKIIQQQNCYHIPPAGDFIKLDAMENPWPMPLELKQPWLETLAELQLNRYPDPVASELVTRLRTMMKIPADAAIILGNGSDELIQIIMMAVADSDRSVLAPAPSFVMYEVLARSCGLSFLGVPLQQDFSLDMPAMCDAIKKHQPAVIFLASPNNPTGTIFQRCEIEEILKCSTGLVVVDEAYQPFVRKSDENFMSSLSVYPNLVVMRTLSKVGLAGIRLGLIAGHADWIKELDKLRLPYNINSLTQTTAVFALDHWPIFQEQIKSICRERDRVYRELSSLKGVSVWRSETNFILFRVPDGMAQNVHTKLLNDGILIKCLHGASSALKNCLRVTIGRPTENDAFIRMLSEILPSEKA